MTSLKNISNKVASAVFMAAALSTPLCAGAQSDTTEYKVLSGVNAMDFRLQKPAPNEFFENKHFGDHLFFSIEGAPTFTHRSQGQLIGRPDLGCRVGFSIGDWFTPVHGMKLGFNLGSRKEFGESKYLFGGVSLDYLMNLSALAHKYAPERKFEFIGVAGVEFQRRFHTANPSNAVGGHLGLQARFNITPTTFVYLEPRINLYSDGVNARRSWQRYDWEGALLVGLGYRISPIAKRNSSYLDNKYCLDNTFYGFSGGAGLIPYGNFRQINDFIGPVGSLYIGKWASTISGWRLMASAGSFGLKNNGHPKFALAEIDYLFNINSAVNGFNPETRFNTNLILGPAAAITSRNPTDLRLGATVGIQGVINLTSNLQFVIEPKATIFNRHFANTGRRANALTTLSIGFQYRLGRYKDALVKYDFSNDTEDFLASNKLFMTFSGGLLNKNSSWGKNVAGSLGFGRWFSPVSAWRLTLNGEYMHNKPRYAEVAINADYMLSLGNMFCGYNPDRIFDIVAAAGVHGGAAHYSGGNHPVYGIQGSLQAKFNVSENVDIFVEPQIKTTRAKGYIHSLDKEWRLMLGFNYKFGNYKKTSGSKSSSEYMISKPNYIALIGGPGIFSQGAKNSSVDKLCGGLDMVFGHKFTHVSSVQAGLGYDFATRQRGKNIAIGTLHADYLLDITQLIDLDPNRIFHISALVGAGVGWSNYPNSSPGLAAQAGLQFKWRASSSVDIIAEPRVNLWQPRVCMMNGITEHFIGAPKLMIGAAYKF